MGKRFMHEGLENSDGSFMLHYISCAKEVSDLPLQFIYVHSNISVFDIPSAIFTRISSRRKKWLNPSQSR